LLVKLEVDLYNFDIDIAALKGEHKRFLDEKLIPALAANRDARLALAGSASRSGEDDHDHVLSGKRAEEVRNYLVAKGVGPQIGETMALGKPKAPGPIEEAHDRAVFIYINFPVKMQDIWIWTDNWLRPLVWDDIVGLDAVGGWPLKNVNLQLKVAGAPRKWDVDGGSAILMPTEFKFEAKGNRSGEYIPRKDWRFPMAESGAQPNDLSQTLYRLSGAAEDLGFIDRDWRKSRFANVVWQHWASRIVVSDPGWVDRGFAEQGLPGSPDSPMRIDAERLLKAGGVEVLYLTYPGKWLFKWLLRSPADVFYCSAAGVTAQNVQQYWKDQSRIKVLINTTSWALDVKLNAGIGVTGLGMDWAKLLKSNGGSLTTILGYRGVAPADDPVGADIAQRMSATIAAGLSDDQWVLAWLKINGDHPGQDTYNAAGIDRRGFWWIEKRSAWNQAFDFFPGFGPHYAIAGPAPLMHP
jgi:hypothetical protein